MISAWLLPNGVFHLVFRWAESAMRDFEVLAKNSPL